MADFVTKESELVGTYNTLEILVDIHTGVNYIVYFSGNSAAMVPRYYADGSLVIDSQEEINQLLINAKNKYDNSKPKFI